MKARILFAAATVALCAAVAIPAVTAQAPEVGIKNPTTATPTTLFFHINGFQDFAINTQKPEDKYAESAGIGLATSSLSCLPNTDFGAPFQDYAKYYGYSSPSYVEYNFEENGRPRTHPERGISYDAVIDSNTPFFLYWYMATQTGAPSSGGPADPDTVPVLIPNIRVDAVIRAGDAISVDDKAYDSGPELVRGSTKPVTIGGGQVIDGGAPSTSNGEVSYMGDVGGKHIYEFKVPMQVTSPVIPRATGYNIRVDFYVDSACPTSQTAANPDTKIMPNLVKIHTSPQFRPRMELAINDPIRLEYLHPQFVGDDLVIHTSMNSAWGNYDVNEQDPDGIQVAITGPSPATSLAKAAIVQRTHEHYHHQEAVDITYVWPYKTDRASNGLYTVEVKFMNDQRTAEASGIAQFEIGKGTVIGCGGVQESAQRLNNDCGVDVQEDGKTSSKGSPGLEFVGVLGMLAAALFVARRRNK
jgi:hypothetical protein